MSCFFGDVADDSFHGEKYLGALLGIGRKGWEAQKEAYPPCSAAKKLMVWQHRVSCEILKDHKVGKKHKTCIKHQPVVKWDFFFPPFAYLCGLFVAFGGVVWFHSDVFYACLMSVSLH